MKTFHLEARRPGGEWGVRSVLREENARQSLPSTDRLHLTEEGVKSLALVKARSWSDMVHDDSEFRVVER